MPDPLLLTLIAVGLIGLVAKIAWKISKFAFRLCILALVIGAVGSGSHLPSFDGINLPSLPAANSNSSSSTTATVTSVADGDTVTVRSASGSTIKVRILGLDTPETRRPGTPIECGGPEASAAMHRLADGRKVTVKTDPSSGETTDRFGRQLAYVNRSDGVDLGERQIRAGLATVYQYQGRRFSRLRRYKAAERDARERGRGTWGPPCNGGFHDPARSR